MINSVPFVSLYSRAIADGVADPVVVAFQVDDPFAVAMAREFYGDLDDALLRCGHLISDIAHISELQKFIGAPIVQKPNTIPIALFAEGEVTIFAAAMPEEC